MNILLVVGVGVALLIVASRTYPFWIARVFGLDDANPPPSESEADGADYIKTPTQVVFAHHFASIAGAGPIVGPIIALSFGWGPAWAWIVVGGVLYGAVHDMSTMCVSVREGGKTIAEIARRTLGNGGYFLFLAFLLLVISVVNAVFLKLSAGALTSAYPLEQLGLETGQTLLGEETGADGVVKGRIGGIATTSVIVMTLAAPILGFLIAKKRLAGLAAFGIAAGVCIVGVLAGFAVPVTLMPETWMKVLAVYVFIACGVPVWLLLQPRDFMNVQILYGGLLLLLGGTVAGGLAGQTMKLDFSALTSEVNAGQPFWPIMFITIACGAISGFHSLVATGTTVKQLPRETDCRRIGYNAMLLESGLALLVIAAIASQMTMTEYTEVRGNPVLAFAVGAGSLFTNLGIPKAVGCVLGILVIEGFLVTTLDTSIRLARYLFEEFWSCVFNGKAPGVLRHPIVNTAIAVGLMLLFAYSEDAAGALWPYFGAGNQLIAALALTTVAIWLVQRRKPALFAGIPAAFMVVTAMAALVWKVRAEATSDDANAVIVAGGSTLLALALGFVIVATLKLRAALRANREP